MGRDWIAEDKATGLVLLTVLLVAATGFVFGLGFWIAAALIMR